MELKLEITPEIVELTYCMTDLMKRIERVDKMIKTNGVDATQDFCIYNARKLLRRYRKKNGFDYVAKAFWYLTKYIELEENKNEN